MKNSVTIEQIDKLIAESTITVQTVYEKVTVVCCKLLNGFVITESSGAVDKANYSEEIGAECCMEKIKNKLWEFEGYALANKIKEEK